MGHDDGTATAAAARLAEKIEREAASTDEAVELALLLLEPLHRELEAVAVLEDAHGRDPDDPEAAFWLAHTLHHEVMTQAAQQRGADLLRPLTTGRRPWAGAALLLLAQVLDELPNPSAAERRRMLALSVAAEPGWVNNHESLAWMLLDADHVEEACAELAAARANVLDAPSELTLRQARFEQLITGRTGDGAADRLDRALRQAGCGRRGG